MFSQTNWWFFFSGNFEPNQVFQVWLSKVPRPQRIRNQSIGFEVQKQVRWMLGSCQSHWFSILRFWFDLWNMPICYFFWHGQNDARYRLYFFRVRFILPPINPKYGSREYTENTSLLHVHSAVEWRRRFGNSKKAYFWIFKFFLP